MAKKGRTPLFFSNGLLSLSSSILRFAKATAKQASVPRSLRNGLPTLRTPVLRQRTAISWAGDASNRPASLLIARAGDKNRRRGIAAFHCPSPLHPFLCASLQSLFVRSAWNWLRSCHSPRA